MIRVLHSCCPVVVKGQLGDFIQSNYKSNSPSYNCRWAGKNVPESVSDCHYIIWTQRVTFETLQIFYQSDVATKRQKADVCVALS